MAPKLFGIEHILYIIISTVVAVVCLTMAKKHLKDERSRSIFLKILALFLLVSITANRLSQVFRYEDVRWYCIIPDSYCGMTSLVLAPCRFAWQKG